ncbi:MAG: hypothetical protein RPU52_08015 [Candidatus Sedimenticola sp. (ex Thyasira tokunagai)]
MPTDKTISSVAVSDFGYGGYPDTHTQTTPCHARGNMLVSPSEPEEEPVTGTGKKYTGTAKLGTSENTLSENTLLLTGKSVGYGSCGGSTCGGCLDKATLTITYE